ncbi:MAG: hypothetical protein KDC34_16175 [Saprospiraceae bacterium]|nr:hypothetical protein [Saprospiraceae bacterium]
MRNLSYSYRIEQFILISLFVLLGLSASAQIGLQFNYIKPSQEFGFLFKPTVGIEGTYSTSYADDKHQFGGGIGFFAVHPRADTIPTSYVIQFDNNNGGVGTFLPGFEIWEYYRVLSLNGTYTFKILDKPISPIIGFDISAHFTFYEYQRNTAGYSDLDATSGGLLFTGYPKAGFQINIKDTYLITCAFGKSMGITEKYIPQSYWKGFVNLSYFLN